MEQTDKVESEYDNYKSYILGEPRFGDSFAEKPAEITLKELKRRCALFADSVQGVPDDAKKAWAKTLDTEIRTLKAAALEAARAKKAAESAAGASSSQSTASASADGVTPMEVSPSPASSGDASGAGSGAAGQKKASEKKPKAPPKKVSDDIKKQVMDMKIGMTLGELSQLIKVLEI